MVELGLGLKIIVNIIISMFNVCLISYLISDFSIIVALVGRFFATGAYYVCLQYASELFPTSIRGAGLSACEVFGGVGLLLSPWIVYLVSERSSFLN